VGTVKIIAGFLLFALFLSTGWQIAACEFANIELKDDLKDLSAMGASRIGLAGMGTDGELRDAVIRRAAGYDIHLVPDQIFVRRSGTVEAPVVFLAVKYRTRVRLPWLSLIIHFTATSR
jgi:hypothetical protein